MTTPLKERPKVLIPLPPLPEFYQQAREGETMAPTSTSSSSHAKKTTKPRQGDEKVVRAVEVRYKTTTKPHQHTTPSLPPARPLPVTATVDAMPILPHEHLPPPPVKLPPFPPPPPPAFEQDSHENMNHRYSYRHHHEYNPSAYKAKPTKEPRPEPARVINIPPPPPGFPGGWVETEPVAQATLTICHICRICQRPRSEKYHLEHPVPIDGVLPPPGICKRCRITSIEEKNDHMKLVHIEESDKVRVGVSAFVPKDSLYTRKEAGEAIRKQHRRGYGELYVREGSSGEEEPEQVVYRYTKRTRKSMPDPLSVQHPEVSVENLAAMNLMNDQSPGPDTKRTTMKFNVGSDYGPSPEGGRIRYPPQTVRVEEIRRVDRSEAPDSLATTKSTRSSTTATATKGKGASSAKNLVSVKSMASSQSKVTATAAVTTPASHGYTESEIRTFARDEVERYRQAERMIHAHPNAYAHGRTVRVVPAVPVERRIETVRDTVAPKPWEVPPPPPPPEEEVFATLRSRNASSASKDGSGRVEREPSEESRHWFRPSEPSSSTTKSASSRTSTSTVKQPSTRQSTGRGDDRPYHHDTEITFRHEQRSEPPRRLPESDPPTSVKLKEVVGIVREEPRRAKRSSTSSGRKYERDIIEVTEEIELPPGTHLGAPAGRTTDPAISQRVRILRAGRDSKRPSQASRSRGESRDVSNSKEARTRTETEKLHWESDHGVRSASGLSSARPVIRTDVGVMNSDRHSEIKTDITIEEPKATYSMPSPRQFIPTPSSHGRSDYESWYASRVQNVKTHEQTPAQHTTEHQEEDEKTVWQADETPIRPAASSRMSMAEFEDDDDWDWEYRKRIVTASDCPPGRIDDESAPGRRYTDTERMLRCRRPSQSSGIPEKKPTHSSHHSHVRRTSPKPPISEIAVSTEIEEKASHNRGRGPYMRTSEESAHVRFASKVDFSPTPPGSDASLPHQFRQSRPSSHASRSSTKKSALRNQIDGGASEPPESAESLVAEYETTKAHRSHSIEREEDPEYLPAKPTSSARGSGHSGSAAKHSTRSEPRNSRSQESRRSARELEGDNLAHAVPLDEVELHSGHANSAAQNSTRSEPRSFRSQDSRRSTRAREDHDDFTRDVPLDELERRSGRSARRSSQEDAETATQLSRSRRLARALSESPSRERMQQEYIRVQQQQEQRSETVISRGRQQDWDWDDSKGDGKGPYREETRTESLDALYGSGHGGARKRQHEYVVHEKW